MQTRVRVFRHDHQDSDLYPKRQMGTGYLSELGVAERVSSMHAEQVRNALTAVSATWSACCGLRVVDGLPSQRVAGGACYS